MGRGQSCIPDDGTNIPGFGIYLSGKIIVLLFTVSALVAIAGITLTAVGFAQTDNTPFSMNDEEENFFTRHTFEPGNPMTVAGPILIIVGVLFTILFGALWMMNWDTSRRIFEERHYAPALYHHHHTGDSEELKPIRARRGDDIEKFDREPRNGVPPYQPAQDYPDDSSPEQGSKSDRGGVGKSTGV